MNFKPLPVFLVLLAFVGGLAGLASFNLRPYGSRFRLAQEITGVRPQIVKTKSGEIFLSRSVAVIFFNHMGMRAPVRGMVVIDRKAGRVKDVRLDNNIEGIDRKMGKTESFFERFIDAEVSTPAVVDVVTGASISSQAIIDGVNDALNIWREYVDSLSTFSQDLI